MGLNTDALQRMRDSLERISRGERVQIIEIGEVTPAQFAALNKARAMRGLPALESPKIVFIGRHMFDSRVTKQGYTIDDVMLQIESSMSEKSVCNSATSIQSTVRREDGYGNTVRDRAVFECTQRRPFLELSSVVPTGDTIRPEEARRLAKEKAAKEATCDS